jgi:hypothetical protein
MVMIVAVAEIVVAVVATAVKWYFVTNIILC